MSSMPLVLASSSPRRQQLLRDASIEFVVRPANIPEIRLPFETPKRFAERMAREKAAFIWNGESHGKGAVLGADTVVVIGDDLLGKPTDPSDAARMLRLLSGRKHFVITGVFLVGSGFEDIRSETTAVYFSKLSEGEISSYVESGEPMDKAGAYAIQGGASRWVLKTEGDYNNVVGLPAELVRRMLQEHGIA